VSNLKSYVWSQCWRVTAPFLRSGVRRPAAGLLALLVVCALSVSGLNVVNSYVGRDFMTAAAARDAGRFTRFALLYVAMFGACTVVAVFYRFVEERLGLLWREWLTGHLIDRYVGGQAHRRLSGRQEVDNPDQRITEDVKAFTTTSLSFLVILLNSAITLCAFAGVLWSITPWLFVAAIGYAAFGSVMAVLLGRRLVGLNFAQLKQEADLRYELIRIREGKGLAVARHGVRWGHFRIHGRLGDVIANSKRIIGVNRNLGFVAIGYDYLIQILPVVIVVPIYFAGRVEFGVVTQSLVVFTHVLGAFSLIVKEFQRLSAFKAVAARIGTLWEGLEGSPPTEARPGPETDALRTDHEPPPVPAAVDDLATVSVLPLVTALGLTRRATRGAAGVLAGAAAAQRVGTADEAMVLRVLRPTTGRRGRRRISPGHRDAEAPGGSIPPGPRRLRKCGPGSGEAGIQNPGYGPGIPRSTPAHHAVGLGPVRLRTLARPGCELATLSLTTAEKSTEG
jgi:ABC-type uncharacterized transport system fused permease/ATPase subunit